MALIDKASLLMVPSTYEAGKLYNVLPSGNRAPDSTDQNSGYDQTRADFDFDRGSNTAATRVNASGLIEKYRENLLLQSNQFDTTWTNSSSTETGGQIGYDGTSNAWLLSKTSAGGRINQSVSLSGVQTLSMYAKAGSLNWMRFITIGGTTSSTYYDLENGTIGANISSIDTNIESVGNGWYRCSVTTNQPLTEIRIYPADGDNDTSGTSGSIFIQSAQLEKSLVATDYLESTSVTGKAGVLVDLPRINYDANGENGALLLEPSRQNNILYSENVTNSWWLKSNVTALDNQGISPEGLNNAGEITLTSTGGAVLYRTSLIIGDGVLSFFAKPGTLSGGRIRVSVDGIGAAYWNLDGTISSVSGGTAEAAENYGNGWFRYSYNVPSGSVANYGVQGGIIGESMLVYGMQVEPNASYPSSYIPTMGTSETRAADSCSVTGASDVIGQTEGTLFAEIERKDGEYGEPVWLSDGSYSNYIFFVVGSTNTRFVGVTGGTQWNIIIPALSQGVHKIAGAYKQNDIVLYIDGVNRGEDTTANIPTCSLLGLGYENGNIYTNGDPYKQVALFKERLTNEELATLTTL